MSLTPGTQLGPYVVVAPLGAGGMGEVYRARDTRLGRHVAIKVLPSHLAASPEDRARFQREAKAISALNHPHICVLHDVGREGDTDFLVMELVEGETLQSRLTRGPLTTAEALRIGAQIADALSRAHRAGVVHRDLKPGNVMLTKGGVKLMDFGLARQAAVATPGGVTATAPGSPGKSDEPITRKGTVVGTFQYMAPEQLEGLAADERSDIWALGCVLYEMATGKRAFEGTTAASIISAIMRDQPRVMAELAPMTPRALERAVKQCLEKDPENRWQSAADLMRELRWIESDASGTSQASQMTRTPRRSAWVLASSVLALGVLTPFILWRNHQPATRPLDFTPLTFQTMAIYKAAFAPDGKTVIFSGALEGIRPRLFVARPEYPEPQPLTEPGMHLLSVSSKGELAVLTGAKSMAGGRNFVGTLARMALGGGAPREIVEKVHDADWSPDGSQLAILRYVSGRDRLEFPIGTVLCESTGLFTDVRVSPRGDQVAFAYHQVELETRSDICVVDRQGAVKRLTNDYTSKQGIAWSPDGKEILYSASSGGDEVYTIFGITLSGVRRVALQAPGGQAIHDVSSEGRWLTTRDERTVKVMVHKPEWPEDRDFSWLDSSVNALLSRDGGALVFVEQSARAGSNYSLCFRKLDGSPVVRLGEGLPLAISSDGSKVLGMLPTSLPRLIVYPTGAGDPLHLESGGMQAVAWASWFSAGDSILFKGIKPGGGWRLYVQSIRGGQPRPVSPESPEVWVWSKDLTHYLVREKDGRFFAVPIGGGDRQPILGLTKEDFLAYWNSTKGEGIVQVGGRYPPTIERVDLKSGRHSAFATLAPTDRSGLQSCFLDDVSEDEKSYAYHAWWLRSSLFTVERQRGDGRTASK